MAVITEIAPDMYRISIYVPEIDLQFNQFLVKDDEPLLFGTGSKAMFPLMRDALARLIDPGQLRWIAFSHFEADECGALNHFLELAPGAKPACNRIGALVSVNDFALRPAYALAPNDVLTTGKYRYRFCPTPHVPHGWDSGVLFEETQRTLLCSDLFFHDGQVELVTELDLVERTRHALLTYEDGPLAGSAAYTPQTEPILHGLAELKPRTLATGHGSTFVGDGARQLRDLHLALKETFGWMADRQNVVGPGSSGS